MVQLCSTSVEKLKAVRSQPWNQPVIRYAPLRMTKTQSSLSIAGKLQAVQRAVQPQRLSNREGEANQLGPVPCKPGEETDMEQSWWIIVWFQSLFDWTQIVCSLGVRAGGTQPCSADGSSPGAQTASRLLPALSSALDEPTHLYLSVQLTSLAKQF